MTGSMYAAISGLKSHMNALSVIGNNISNVNTLGYKTTRYTFNEALYTTQRTGSDGTASLGGVNPAQIGFGASLGTIDLDMSTKNYTLTGKNLDTMIDGDGFFIVGDKVAGGTLTGKAGIDFDGDPGEIALLKGMNLTRLGNFNIDAQGYLVDGNGSVVWGFLETGVGGYNNNAEKEATVDPTKLADYSDRKLIEYINGIADRDTRADVLEDVVKARGWHNVSKNPDGMITSVSTTNNSTLTALRMPMFAEAEIVSQTEHAITSGTPAETGTPLELPADRTGATAIIWPNDNNTAISVDDAATGAILYDGTNEIQAVPVPVKDENGDTVKDASGNDVTTTVYRTTTYYDSTGKVVSSAANAAKSVVTEYKIGDYTRLQPDSVSINDKTGALTVLTSDQQLITIGYLAIGKVTNPNGVTHVDGRYYQAKDGAGELRVTTIGGAVEGVESAGDTALITGGLESSGTDLATEITNMITVQRGYQANTRIVTVTDSMLEELVNMKR